ncbi:hypothetical protein Cfla_2340 [Cellulomonas flavigena DSM 20109]|uniref:Uncharacterized protein n=1 Tax=Cellulomonas flavigena (strain ATCC 482 / DSM 20109 / BCRC 11376 / JCM 18109 / NBRC 3775 / NCIMB 8073 / NRS 134) TaxID=446466 RepID=D5UHA9_CELFN|nr:hypothetical protein [Cellulomonas flavigena]ADG75230.1 hypothetical protein Cfla_2340 [Cellulomonas flavigena DSM 20109]
MTTTDPTGGAATPRPATDLEPWARALLRCPVTGAELVDGVDEAGAPVLVSTDPARPLAYPVVDGIPVLLTDEARPA